MFERWIHRVRNAFRLDRNEERLSADETNRFSQRTVEQLNDPPLLAGAPPRILVVSSAGVHNHGDDAILLSTLQRLDRLRPGCEAIVVTDADAVPPLGAWGTWAGTCRQLCAALSPQWIQQGCSGHKNLAKRLPLWVEARNDSTATPRPVQLTSFDLVLLCGGGNLTHHFPPVPAWRTAIAVAARAFGIPYVVSGQGVGPVDDDVREMLTLLVPHAVRFGVRDPLSLALLHEIGLAGPRTACVGDDALGLAVEEPTLVRQRLRTAGVPDERPLLGFHVREAHYVGFGREELRAFARRMDEAAATLGMTVAAIPINTDVARPEVDLLMSLASLPGHRAPWYVVDAGEDAAAAACVLKACTAVVACSFHMVLFALESRIPALLFARSEYYQRKSEGLQAAFGIPAPVTLTERDDAAAIVRRLKQLQRLPWSPLVDAAQVDAWLNKALTLAEQRSRVRLRA